MVPKPDQTTSAPPSLHVDVRLALDRFDLAVAFTATRPVTGVFGASGAGKTSLIEAIAGLRRPARGVIRLGGEVWLDSTAGVCRRPEERQIGYVPQDGLLFPHLDVRGNLLVGRRRAERRGQRPAETLATVVELLELGPLLGRAVDKLSGGERQRVALGRALCSGPHLLLLDEPLAALDLPLRRKLLPFLRRVRAELTVPMVLVSHDPIEVQALCDELVVLRAGAVVARGEPRAVLTDPAVFALAEKEGFENVLPGRVVRREGALTIIRLGAGVELSTVGTASPGDEVLVGLPAFDVLLATERPRGLSARNVLAARTLEVRTVDGLALVTAELAPDVPPVTVEVAEATPAELGVAPGRPVFLVIKATSCRLYGGAER